MRRTPSSSTYTRKCSWMGTRAAYGRPTRDRVPCRVLRAGPCPAPVAHQDVGAVLAEPACGGTQLEAASGQDRGSQEDLDVPRLEREGHVHARLSRPGQGPAGVAPAVDVPSRRAQGAQPAGGLLPAGGVEDGHDPAVHAVGHVQRPGRQGELVDAAPEVPRDELARGLEEGVPLGPHLHPPARGVLVEVPDLGGQVTGAEGRAVERGQVGEQARCRVLHQRSTQACRLGPEPVVADRRPVVDRGVEPPLGPTEVHRTSHGAPERPRQAVQPRHQRAHGRHCARGVRRARVVWHRGRCRWRLVASCTGGGGPPVPNRKG